MEKKKTHDGTSPILTNVEAHLVGSNTKPLHKARAAESQRKASSMEQGL